ncbi:MAG TPA: MFS transporter, partial [Pseudomonadales bacterium]|nr:MFS transporter [Pseudomonadales bacterium]
MTTTPSLTITNRFYFGLGQAADYIKNFGFGTLLLLYYNQVLGLPGAYAGMAMSISIGFDAIIDPVVGSWSDGFQSPWGRRHPFMIGSILPLTVTFFFLFWPPTGLSGFWLFVWLTTFAVLSRASLSFFNVPYYALGAEMTQDYYERTQLVVIRTAFGIVSNFVVIAIAWNFIFVQTPEVTAPQLNRAPYFKYAMVSAMAMAMLMFLSCWGTRNVIRYLAGSKQPRRRFSMKRVYSDLFYSLQNRSFRALFIGTLLFFVYAGTTGALSMHLLTFFWQLDAHGIEYIQYGTIAGGILALPLVPYLNRRMEKKGTLY